MSAVSRASSCRSDVHHVHTQLLHTSDATLSARPIQIESFPVSRCRRRPRLFRNLPLRHQIYCMRAKKG